MDSTNIPVPLTSFIGRERELGEIEQLLATARLVTLTGAGGSGKTRLAIQIANTVSGKLCGWCVAGGPGAAARACLHPAAGCPGVWPAPIRRPTLLETLLNFIHSKQLLLILDNCEHLSCLRAACPGIALPGHRAANSGDQPRTPGYCRRNDLSCLRTCLACFPESWKTTHKT
jgi:hypothetical protein